MAKTPIHHVPPKERVCRYCGPGIWTKHCKINSNRSPYDRRSSSLGKGSAARIMHKMQPTNTEGYSNDEDEDDEEYRYAISPKEKEDIDKMGQPEIIFDKAINNDVEMQQTENNEIVITAGTIQTSTPNQLNPEKELPKNQRHHNNRNNNKRNAYEEDRSSTSNLMHQLRSTQRQLNIAKLKIELHLAELEVCETLSDFIKIKKKHNSTLYY